MTQSAARQPIFNIPRSVLVVIVVMAAIQAAQSVLPDASTAALLVHLAFVPARLTAGIDPAAVFGRLLQVSQSEPDGPTQAEVARFFLGSGSLQPWTLLTYALLHAGWTHLGLNAVWLLAFGAPVERRLGPARFLALLALGAIAGAAAHYAVDPLSLQPLVGASAAVSAAMGAALRFVFRPPLSPDAAQAATTARPPRLALTAILRDRRAAAFLVVWFVSNFATGVAAIPLGLSDMPIAWQAHVGGFLLGLLAFPLFDTGPSDTGPPQPPRPDTIDDPADPMPSPGP